MPDKELQKFKQFMLESQSQSEARMGKFAVNMVKLEGIVSRLANFKHDHLNKKLSKLSIAQAQTDRKLKALIDKMNKRRKPKS